MGDPTPPQMDPDRVPITPTDVTKTADSPAPSALKSAKVIGAVAWRFTQTLLKRIPDVVDENPVKVAFGIAKLILELSEVRRNYFHRAVA